MDGLSNNTAHRHLFWWLGLSLTFPTSCILADCSSIPLPGRYCRFKAPNKKIELLNLKNQTCSSILYCIQQIHTGTIEQAASSSWQNHVTPRCTREASDFQFEQTGLPSCRSCFHHCHWCSPLPPCWRRLGTARRWWAERGLDAAASAKVDGHAGHCAWLGVAERLRVEGEEKSSTMGTRLVSRETDSRRMVWERKELGLVVAEVLELSIGICDSNSSGTQTPFSLESNSNSRIPSLNSWKPNRVLGLFGYEGIRTFWIRRD